MVDRGGVGCRAGRNGGPSRAVLLYSWADRRTHEFLVDRDYPARDVLANVFNRLTSRPRPAAKLCAETGLENDVFGADSKRDQSCK